MFKCKQCGHPFGANIPDKCPACGAQTNQPEGLNNRGLLGLLFIGAFSELLIFAIILGIVIALAIKYL